MKKRILSLLLAVCMMVGLLPTAAFAEGNAWDGSTADTAWYNTNDTSFLINTASELAGLAQIVNGTAGGISQDSFAGKTITLTNDIDLDLMSWTPIGSSATPFQGTFDGDSHSIKGLYIKVSGNNQGLFGYIKSADIRNVTLSNVIVSGDTNIGGIAGTAENSTLAYCTTVNDDAPNERYGWGIRGSESVGGIVGCSQDSHIQNCTNNAYVYLLINGNEPARHKLGGIAGVATLSADACSEGDAVLISDCVNTGPITCTTEANYECTGGIVGRLVSDNADYRAIVKSCKNTGTVSSIEAGTGGIVGYAQNASIENCINENAISGTTGVGGIAGYAYYGTQILDCNNSGSVTGNMYSSTNTTVYPYNIGGIVGSIYNPRDTTHLEGDCDSLPVYSYNRDSLISNCTNSGAVTCSFDWSEAEPTIRFVDGAPYAINIYGSFTGGIAGLAVDSAYFDEEGNAVSIEGCTNSGSVNGKTYTGGVLGVGKNAEVAGCTNSGVVTDADVSDSDTIRADIGSYSYTVRFDANGGAVKPEDTLKIAGYSVLCSFPTPTRDGCSFDGWFTDAVNGTAVTTETLFHEKTTLYAHWSPLTYNVKLNTNGGTINSGDVDKYIYGQGAALPTEVTKTGYRFKGWYDNKNFSGSPVTAISDTDTDNKEYWAKWEAITAPTGGSGSGTTSPTPPPDPKPSIGGFEKSWSAVAADLAKLASGSEATIELNGIKTVPVEVIKIIDERDLKVTFVIDSVRRRKTDGAEITAPAAADLTLTKTTSTKSEGLRGIEGTQFAINDTGIPTSLEIAFKAEHAGKFANLYKNVDGKLMFVTCAKLGSDGKFSDLSGDIDNDGILNAKDALAVLKDFLGIEKGANPLVADMNSDGFINPKDAMIILKKYLGIE